MNVFTKIFGSKNKEEIDQTAFIDNIIKHSKDEPLGISEENIIYAGYNELGGYYYFQTYIIGRLNKKVKTGATLLIEGEGYTLDLKSDMDEFEAEKADIFNGFVTRIDFEIEKETVEKIRRSTIKKMIVKIEKHELVFMPYNQTKDKKIN
ncbi:MAG: hypothetical protein WBF67_11495 [Olleya sp.]